MAEVTDHRTLLSLLGEWVTVTHPDAPHRVWHGQLASLMDSPSIVLQMPEGGTEVLPQVFDVQGAAPAEGGPHPDVDAEARTFAALRDSGLLWLINRVALHPRGLALALHLDEHGQAYGWSLVASDEGEPWMFAPATDNDGYRRAEKTIAAALDRDTGPARCCVCGGRPVVYENYKDQPFCAGCANCDCGHEVCVRSRPAADTSSPGEGVRVEYRARVPRDQGPAALAEAFQAISDAKWPATGNECAGHRPDAIRTPSDEHPDTGDHASGRTRPPVLGATPTSTDSVRTPDPDTTSGRLDGNHEPSGIRGLLEHVGMDLTGRCIRVADRIVDHAPGCSCGTTADAREHIANAMELPLDLIAPPLCDCGQTGPLIGDAGGHHFHIRPEDHEQLRHDRADTLARVAWGNCWDRAEALRLDLERAHNAYETLRARVVTTSKYVRQQQQTGFPFGSGDNRQRILDTLAVWTEDPGPLQLTTTSTSKESRACSRTS
ncbi:hypothetical protein ACFY64_31585 [Streptomyces collinus]|uniref:hypothetical protein n=1 Tax=Streptomyces collinus TaxID=42684 RepID=UPI0036C818FD